MAALRRVAAPFLAAVLRAAVFLGRGGAPLLGPGLRGGRDGEVARLVLTAAGGPFRGRRREELAMERLAQAEQSAVAEVRNRAVDVALEATRRILVAEMTADRADTLIDATIKELPQKLKLH